MTGPRPPRYLLIICHSTLTSSKEKNIKKKLGENSWSCQNYMALLIELGPVMYFNLYDAVQPTQVCCAVNLVT